VTRVFTSSSSWISATSIRLRSSFLGVFQIPGCPAFYPILADLVHVGR
jgi:hypothetical protein